ncbi:ankyrin repeat and protein kinase domain-containing protein 1-like isoform X2 [Pyxicephalus adspersus]
MMMRANSTYVLRVLAMYENQEKEDIEYGLVMEYMPYGSLHSLFETFMKKNFLVPWALRFQILHQVALAMNFLHSLDPAIIHQDLKPQNVLLRKDLDVQLTDFGLARKETSVSTSIAGTVSYMPPEALVSDEFKPTKEFDVYSFAILIWSVLSGKVPYYGINENLIIYHVPNGIRPERKFVDCWKTEKMVPEAIKIMEQCWHNNPKLRPCFAECMEQLEKMRKAYDGETEDAVFDVLNKLRTNSSSSQKSWVADIPDGSAIPEVSDTDLNSLKIEDFINGLKQENHESPPVKHDESADSNPSSEPSVIDDAKGFLKRNFSKIIQEKPDWNYILDDLYTQNIFQTEQVDIIRHNSLVQNQIRETLDMIMKQGEKSCRVLVQLMIRYHYSIIKNLAT